MKLNDFLRNFFTKNLGLKLLSLFLAFAFWIAFVNLADPVSTDTYQIRLTVENMDEHLASGHYLELADGGNLQDKVLSVTVRAHLSVLKALRDSKNIESVVSAYVDAYEAENGVLKIHYAVDPGYADAIDLNSLSNASYLAVVEETMSQKVIPIEAKLSGTPAPGYRILEEDPDFFLTKYSVTLFGPPSRLEDFSRAVAEISVSKASASVTQNRLIRFYDEDGNELFADGKIILTDTSEVGVHVPVYRIKTLTLGAEVNGTAPDGYVYLDDLAFSRESVEVFGLADELRNVDTVLLPAISLNSVTGEYSRVYRLSELLSQQFGGAIRLNENDGTVTVRLHTSPLVSRNIELDLGRLIVNNLPAGWRFEAVGQGQPLILYGLSVDIDAALRSLNYYADLPEELQEGETELWIRLEGLPSSVTLEQAATVVLRLTPTA